MLLRRAADAVAPALPALLTAAAGRLATAESPLLITELLVFLAALAHANAGHLVDFLAGAQAPGAPCQTLAQGWPKPLREPDWACWRMPTLATWSTPIRACRPPGAPCQSTEGPGPGGARQVRPRV